MNNNQTVQDIQHIIDANACGIDGFFNDSSKAAKEILAYLQKRDLLQSETNIHLLNKAA